MRFMTITFLFLWIAACHFGVQEGEFAPAHHPQGIGVELALEEGVNHSGPVKGELLAVREDGFLINEPMDRDGQTTRPRPIFVLFEFVSKARFAQFSTIDMHAQTYQLDMPQRRQLRALSRFPQGISAELLEQLCAAAGVQSVAQLSKE